MLLFGLVERFNDCQYQNAKEQNLSVLTNRKPGLGETDFSSWSTIDDTYWSTISNSLVTKLCFEKDGMLNQIGFTISYLPNDDVMLSDYNSVVST